MFKMLRPTLLQAKNIFSGVTFTNSQIPTGIFSGCTELNNISRFFAHSGITNNGQEFQFPQYEMFKDCTSLKDVSHLFEGAYNLNIKLIGSGFRNCPLTTVEEMLSNSGVFGMIPYKLFETSDSNISNISRVFNGCYKLGYTKDRTLDIGTYYEKDFYYGHTEWKDKVIRTPGTRVTFQLDFTNFDGTDEWYIDGRDWADINSSLTSTQAYNNLSTIFSYDREQKQALSDSRDREVGYQNYMFPADYFKYCSSTCTMEEAFKDLTYTPNVLKDDGTGVFVLEIGTTVDGLVGRLPCKLFSNNIDNTEFKYVFKELKFCAFINFNSYKLNTLNHSASECRGIKLPPDLLSNNINLTSVEGLFQEIDVEVGVDINSNLLTNNVNITNASNLFKNVLFAEKDYKEAATGEYSQIDFENLFKYCSELQNVSNLFATTGIDEEGRGLRIISSNLFGTQEVEGQVIINNPRITNISGMFYNNRLLKGSIPLFDSGSYPRISSFSSYVEGVNKNSITNANVFMSIHPTTWIPLTWLE